MFNYSVTTLIRCLSSGTVALLLSMFLSYIVTAQDSVPIAPTAETAPIATESTNDSKPTVDPMVSVAERFLPETSEIALAREKLALFQIDESAFRRLLQGVALSDEEHELILAILDHISTKRFDDKLLSLLTNSKIDWAKINAGPEHFLGGVYVIEGKLLSMTNLSLDVEPATTKSPETEADETLRTLAERRQIETLYRCNIQVTGVSEPVQVFVLHVPEYWNKKLPVGDRVRFRGFFVKQGGGEQSPAFYFAGARLAWHPDNLLGNANFDFGLLDSVQHGKKLLESEQEVFYSLISAAKQIPPASYASAKPITDLVLQVWQKPQDHVAELMTFRGRIVEISRVDFDDPAHLKKYGYDHYYLMILNIPLKNNNVKLAAKGKEEVDPTDNQTSDPQAEKPPILSELPLWFYCHELPTNRTLQSLKHETIDIQGFFLKSVRYQSELEFQQQKQRLLAPIVMGLQPTVVPDTTTTAYSNSFLAPLVVSVVAVCLVGGLIFIWRQQYERSTTQQLLPDKIQIEE